jgi:hypothetical protein
MRRPPGNARDSLAGQASRAWRPKSPGCLRVPGLFLAIRGPRVEFECSHGFTAIGGRSQAGRGDERAIPSAC